MDQLTKNAGKSPHENDAVKQDMITEFSVHTQVQQRIRVFRYKINQESNACDSIMEFIWDSVSNEKWN